MGVSVAVGSRGMLSPRHCGLYCGPALDCQHRRATHESQRHPARQGRHAVHRPPDEPLAEAVKTMAENDIGSLVVMDTATWSAC